MGISVDRTLNNIENVLSDIAAYPIAGTLAGSTKIALGTTQFLTALACGILLSIPAIATCDLSLLNHSWTHMKHGLGNIVAGILEAIPLFGTILFGLRVVKSIDPSVPVYLRTGHENKWMPYSSLVEQDWDFCGDEALSTRKNFNKIIEENALEGIASLQYKMQIAKQLVGYNDSCC